MSTQHAAAKPDTVTDLLLARATDNNAGLLFEDRLWSWADYVAECARYAAMLDEQLDPARPRHIGVLCDNVPEVTFLLGASALAGTVLVGLNPNRRGAALARDIIHTECQVVLTEHAHAPLLDGLDIGRARVFDVADEQWQQTPQAPDFQPVRARPEDLLMLIFTSGTGGEPKAVRITHDKIAGPGRMLAERFELSGADTAYLSMPLFHSNAVMAGWAVGLASGATLALRRRFSASRFLPDVRRFKATYANYVGTPLSYVLATAAQHDDADNPLRVVYGNEAGERNAAAFAERFDCRVIDAFGSTEGGVNFSRIPQAPPGSLGKPPEGVRVLDPETLEVCPPAEFDVDGRMTNGARCVGELVNTAGTGSFAGYYRDPDADAERVRDGMYFTGDLAYLDADGYCYFAGRRGDWLRVGGENLGTAPIERVLLRHPGVAEAVVYPVTEDGKVGDQVMAALVPHPDVTMRPAEFAEFLTAQPDLAPVQRPSYIRIARELPRTSTYKVIKRQLSAQGTRCEDPVWRWPQHATAPLPL